MKGNLIAQATQPAGILSSDQVRTTFYHGLERRFRGQRLLVLIPDHTRTIPLPFLFRLLVRILHDARQLAFMVALGTHPPLAEEKLHQLVGISAEERSTTYRRVGLSNHAWHSADALTIIGTLSQAQIQEIAGAQWHPSLGGDVDISINRAIYDYDHILILGPTFPHEVAGFSGGAKYLFPGISGPDMIHVTHWLGALAGVRSIIGIKDTPTRRMIHAAAAHLPVPLTMISLVVVENGLAGIFIGDYETAWRAAADLSAQRHIVWVDKPFRKVLSRAPAMYDELWTAGKAMYKLEPALAESGELTIYAPHLDTVSHVHGRMIYEIGYHVLPYFLAQWDRFKHLPLGVLAHSTHIRGDGRFENGIEYPRATVNLASQIPAGACRRLNLGYQDPQTIDPAEWQDQDSLYVARAGEMLYRVQET